MQIEQINKQTNNRGDKNRKKKGGGKGRRENERRKVKNGGKKERKKKREKKRSESRSCGCTGFAASRAGRERKRKKRWERWVQGRAALPRAGSGMGWVCSCLKSQVLKFRTSQARFPLPPSLSLCSFPFSSFSLQVIKEEKHLQKERKIQRGSHFVEIFFFP